MYDSVKMGATDEDWFLLEDLHVRCWTSTHAGYIFGLGLPLLILYVIGVPAVVFHILSKPDNLSKIDRIMTTTQAEDEDHDQGPLHDDQS